MWKAYIENLDVIEVCDWSDASDLIASGNREGIETARERHAHCQVPRFTGKEVVRALRTPKFSGIRSNVFKA